MAGKIREFQAQGDLSPSDRGSTAQAIAAGHVESEYNRIGADLGSGISQFGKQYIQQRTQEETLKALQLASKAQEQATSSWAEAFSRDSAADVHNPNLGVDWRKQALTPALDDIGKTLTTREGQQWWAEHRLNIEQHFTERTTADVSTLAGIQNLQDFDHTAKSSENLAYMDPNSGDLARGNLQTAKMLALRQLAAAGQTNPEAVAAINAHFEQGLATVTIAEGRGLIDKAADPEAAFKQFAASAQAVTHLTDSQRNSLQNYAEETTRQNAVKAKAAISLQEKQEDDAADAVGTKITSSAVQANGSVLVTPDTIAAFKAYADMPGAKRHPEGVRAMWNWIESHANQAQKHDTDDAPTYSDFVQRALLPVGDPKRLTQDEIFLANARFQISDRTMNQLQEQIKVDPTKDPARVAMDKAFGSFLASSKRLITTDSEFGEQDPAGMQLFYQFQQDMRYKIEAAIASGKTPAQVEATLLNAQSPEFIGQYARLYNGGTQSAAAQAAIARSHAPAPARPTTGQPAAVAAPSAPPAPVKPGLSVEEYERQKALRGRTVPATPARKPNAPAPIVGGELF